MTKIKSNVTRETEAKMFEVGKYRPIIVTIKPKVITFRLKGNSKSFDLPIERLYFLAVLADVERKRTLRKKGKQQDG